MEPIVPNLRVPGILSKQSGPVGAVTFKPIQSLGNLKYLVEINGTIFQIQSKTLLEIGKLYQADKTAFLDNQAKLMNHSSKYSQIQTAFQGVSNFILEAFIKSSLPLKVESLLAQQNILNKNPGNEKIKARLLSILESKELDVQLLGQMNSLWNIDQDSSESLSLDLSFKDSLKQTLILLNEREDKDGRWLFLPLDYTVENEILTGLGKFHYDRITNKVNKWGFDVHSDPPLAFFVTENEKVKNIRVFLSSPLQYNIPNLKRALEESGLSHDFEILTWDDYDGVGDGPIKSMNIVEVDCDI